MRDVRIARLARAVESRWPGSLVLVEPFRYPEEPAVRWWVSILGVPWKEWRSATAFARDRGRRLYGEDPVPFLVTAESGANARLLLSRLRRGDGRVTRPSGPAGFRPAPERRSSVLRTRSPRARRRRGSTA